MPPQVLPDQRERNKHVGTCSGQTQQPPAEPE